jgi:hypothetical protein
MVTNGGQKEVDTLLLDRNAQIPLSPSPKDINRQETLYTKLRNDLIHAEERGRNPAAAIVDIENNISEFQRDVTLVFPRILNGGMRTGTTAIISTEHSITASTTSWAPGDSGMFEGGRQHLHPN